MIARISRWTGWIACLVALAACARSEASHKGSVGTEASAPQSASEQSVTFEGTIRPVNATELRAPQNTFRIGNWQSDSSWIEIQELAEDGAEVKEGDVVGRFEFRGKQALPQVTTRIQRAEADRDKSSLDVGDQVAQMRTSIDTLDISATQAELEMQKEGMIAARDLERYRMDHTLAEFEAGAEIDRLKAYQRAMRAESDYHVRAVAAANQDMSRYKMYEDRFMVRAPHDGVVRHAFYQRRRRKVQKGDGMPGGMHFLSVARDDTLEVEFYVPEEKYLSVLKHHKNFVVLSPSSSRTYEVEATSIEGFPQELGFLKQDDALPTAREKMYVVHARFLNQPAELTAGGEVKVRVP